MPIYAQEDKLFMNINKKQLIIVAILLSLAVGFNLPAGSAKAADGFGDNFLNNLTNTGITGGYITKEDAGDKTGQASVGYIDTLIANLILYAISFVGIIFLILIIYSGFQWMNAGGNEQTIDKAKSRIMKAIIGLGITLLAFIITTMIYNYLDKQFLGKSTDNDDQPRHRACDTYEDKTSCEDDTCIWVAGLGITGYCTDLP